MPYNATLWRFHVFRHVVEQGGLTSTAALLHLSQPSVSQQIRALEREFGQPLFLRRRGRRSQLTEAGEVMFQYALEVTEGAADVARVFSEMSAGQRGAISIAASRSIACHLLTPFLATFARAHTDVDLTVRVETQSQVPVLVAEGAVDLGVVVARKSVEGLASEIVGHQRILIVAEPGHPLTMGDPVEPEDVARSMFVCGLGSSRYVALMDECLREIGIDNYPIAVQVGDPECVKSLIRQGLGIGAVLECAVESDIAGGRLMPIPFTRPWPELQVHLIHLPHKRFTPAALRLVSSLRAGFRSTAPTYAREVGRAGRLRRE